MVGFNLQRKSHNKPSAHRVSVDDLVEGVGRDNDEIGLLNGDLIVFLNLHYDSALESVLNLIKCVLSVLSKEAFGLATNDSRPINAAFHQLVFNDDIVFSNRLRFSFHTLFRITTVILSFHTAVGGDG